MRIFLYSKCLLFLISQYELIQLYMQKSNSAADNEDNPDLVAYLLAGATHYFNARFETNLTINNNYKPNCDGLDVEEILVLIENERRGSFHPFKMGPNIKLLTKIVHGNKDAVKCAEACGGFCYGNGCPSAAALRKRFYGAKIYFIFTLDGPECFLCEKEIKKRSLGAHFNKDCKAFGRPKMTVVF